MTDTNQLNDFDPTEATDAKPVTLTSETIFVPVITLFGALTRDVFLKIMAYLKGYEPLVEWKLLTTDDESELDDTQLVDPVAQFIEKVADAFRREVDYKDYSLPFTADFLLYMTIKEGDQTDAIWKVFTRQPLAVRRSIWLALYSVMLGRDVLYSDLPYEILMATWQMMLACLKLDAKRATLIDKAGLHFTQIRSDIGIFAECRPFMDTPAQAVENAAKCASGKITNLVIDNALSIRLYGDEQIPL